MLKFKFIKIAFHYCTILPFSEIELWRNHRLKMWVTHNKSSKKKQTFVLDKILVKSLWHFLQKNTKNRIMSSFQSVTFKIPVRNRRDPVVFYLSEAMSERIGRLDIENVRSMEELRYEKGRILLFLVQSLPSLRRLMYLSDIRKTQKKHLMSFRFIRKLVGNAKIDKLRCGADSVMQSSGAEFWFVLLLINPRKSLWAFKMSVGGSVCSFSSELLSFIKESSVTFLSFGSFGRITPADPRLFIILCFCFHF